jgi:protein-tyrosine-phosphatase/predicted ATP-grasp superfamily ATP-dependent carboligase
VTARVLVLDGHSAAALATVQSLGRAKVAIDLASEDSGCLAFRSRYPRRRLAQPSTVPELEFLGWLRDLDAREGYDLVVPSTELSLLALRHLSPHDPLRARAVLATDESLDVALSKERTWQLARDVGIPVPDSALVETLDRVPPVTAYPVVIKPVRTVSVVDGQPVLLAPAVVSDDTTRLAYLQRWLSSGPLQQQAYVSGRGVGIEWLYDRGRAVWVFAHERIHETPLTGGASCYRRSIRPPDGPLLASRRLLDRLQWHGVAMVEFRMDGDGTFWLMEINPRLWGSLPLAIDAGVDFPLGLLRLARGEPVPEQPEYRVGRYARNLGGDVAWIKANLSADRRNPLLLTRPRFRSLLEYLRPLIGRERWDFFDWKDLGVTYAGVCSVLGAILRLARRRRRSKRLTRLALRRHREIRSRLETTGALRRILFVCQGNICRSPFAAAAGRRVLPHLEIDSAGLDPREGRNAPPFFLDLAQRRGEDLTTHKSRSLHESQLEQADLILAMDLDNYEALLAAYPYLAARVTLLGLFAYPPLVSVRDPIDMMPDEAGAVLTVITQSIGGLRSWINQQPPGMIQNSRATTHGSSHAL